jgi:sugar phosphate isomerase/epimerase
MHSPLSRRSFLGMTSLATLASVTPSLQAANPALTKLKLGYDNFAVRAMGWKADQLLDYANELKCDSLFISDLESYESLEDSALNTVRAKSEKLGIPVYAGGWSICPTSVRFKDKWGSAEDHLRLGIRVAKTLGSPVYRVILGAGEDRKTPGGIRARIADTVKVLKACKADALKAGVKIAVENHAGDLHSWELVELIEAAGPDFVGANIDSGNSTWTLEDPMDVLENLGKYVLCSSLRDDMIWQTEDGAEIAWTAAGEGLMDWEKYLTRWTQLCPNVPVFIETISGFSKKFAYKKPEFWEHFDRKDAALANFEKMARQGKPIPPFRPPVGADKKLADQEYQKGEVARSIRYLREKIGIGVRRS